MEIKSGTVRSGVTERLRKCVDVERRHVENLEQSINLCVLILNFSSNKLLVSTDFWPPWIFLVLCLFILLKQNFSTLLASTTQRIENPKSERIFKINNAYKEVHIFVFKTAI